MAADLPERDRVNVFEQWETVDGVDRFRGSGPSAEQHSAINEATVVQYTISNSKQLT